jgi:hypothetical protein
MVPRSNLFHGQWAFRREAFESIGGYDPTKNNGEDQDIAHRLMAAGIEEADPIALGFDPFYVYPWGGPNHFSGMGERGYVKAARVPSGKNESIPIGWSRQWDKMPISTEIRPRKF